MQAARLDNVDGLGKQGSADEVQRGSNADERNRTAPDLDYLPRTTDQRANGLHQRLQLLFRSAAHARPQYYTDDCLRTRKRRMVTAPCRVLSSGSRSILARPGEE